MQNYKFSSGKLFYI